MAQRYLYSKGYEAKTILGGVDKLPSELLKNRY
jgi:hypothetical protein